MDAKEKLSWMDVNTLYMYVHVYAHIYVYIYDIPPLRPHCAQARHFPQTTTEIVSTCSLM